MNNDRRKFLKNVAIGGGAIAAGLPAMAGIIPASDQEMENSIQWQTKGQRFNMSGYAAPKLDKVRIGVIGLGQRGSEAVSRLSYIDGVEITALCDKYPDRVSSAQKTLSDMKRPKAKEYSGEEGWKALCESNDVDLVYTPTPWHLHTPIAVYAMKQGKHAATEVPGAKTLDECWELVEKIGRAHV